MKHNTICELPISTELKINPYIFDLQGYQYFPQVLTLEEQSLFDFSNTLYAYNGSNWRKDYLLNNFSKLRQLLSVFNLSSLFGGSTYRLDHDFYQVLVEGSISKTLHGGGSPHDPSQFYKVSDGKIFNGLVTVLFNLTNDSTSDGGFCCIPGSHKSNFYLPSEYRSISTDNTKLKRFDVEAGSAIVFTEALTHGTFPWAGKHSRKSFFIKFSPRYMAWDRYRYSFSHPLIYGPSMNVDVRLN